MEEESPARLPQQQPLPFPWTLARPWGNKVDVNFVTNLMVKTENAAMLLEQGTAPLTRGLRGLGRAWH